MSADVRSIRKDTYSSTRKYLRELYAPPGGQEVKSLLTIRPTSEEAGVTPQTKNLRTGMPGGEHGDSHRDEDASHAKNGDTPLDHHVKGSVILMTADQTKESALFCQQQGAIERDE